MDDWIDTIDDLPMIEKGMTHVSVNVIARMADGRSFIGFYDYRNNIWY